jgi:hypothetical protein
MAQTASGTGHQPVEPGHATSVPPAGTRLAVDIAADEAERRWIAKTIPERIYDELILTGKDEHV